LAHGFGRGLRLLMAAAVPACVLLGTLAEPLITTVYGVRWAAAAGPLRFLAALGLLRVAFELAYDCLSAAGRRRSLLAVQGAWLIALIPVLVVFAHWHGIVGVGAGHVVVAGLLALPAFVVAVRRAGVPVRTIYRAVGPAFLAGGACGLLSWSVYRLLGDNALGLFVAGTAGLVGYAAVLWPWARTWRGPTRDGPTRDGPTQDGPTRDGPTRDGPTQDGPTRDGGRTRGGPTGGGSTRDGRIRGGRHRARSTVNQADRGG
jgi:PST family polysaccharide transporter